MSEALKQALRRNDCAEHVEEFGECIGTVIGPVDYNNDREPYDPSKVGPEVDVRWHPSELRYACDSDDLERV